MMKHHPLSIPLLMSLVLLFSHAATATPPEDDSKQSGTSCIRGTVWYRSPADATQVPYPRAKITAWRHGTREGLAETRADKRGRFCIEVPLGVAVDLRVWGLEDIGGTSFLCRGSSNKVESGAGAGKCGGDCIQVDIMTECTDQIPRRRRP
jgi:hypothetical protein